MFYVSAYVVVCCESHRKFMYAESCHKLFDFAFSLLIIWHYYLN